MAKVKSFSALTDKYINSNEFNGLVDTTKSQYKYWLRLANDALPSRIHYNAITGAVANKVID